MLETTEKRGTDIDAVINGVDLLEHVPLDVPFSRLRTVAVRLRFARYVHLNNIGTYVVASRNMSMRHTH